MDDRPVSLFAPSPGVSALGTNVPELSVSELSGALKRTVEESFARVRVRGELSAVKFHSSGHVYTALKDEGAVIDAVCWRSQVGKLKIRPAEGMDVICTGRLTTYPARSSYQLVIEQIELAGIGAILKMLDDRRQKLAAEGLFAAERKRPLPLFPQVIGVITSPTGAVIRDILHRLSDRFPCRVLLWPVAVQGEGAADQVRAAIEGFNALPPGGDLSGEGIPRPDVLIVARGGGSFEDLMPFYDEALVRAVAGSRIPLISAVGHETDTTLIDHAADVRAPTPTAAAEMAVPVRLDLLCALGEMGLRGARALHRQVELRGQRLSTLGARLGSPGRLIELQVQRLDHASERLAPALSGRVERWRARLAETVARLRHPALLVAERTRYLAVSGDRLVSVAPRLVLDPARRLDSLSRMLDSLSFRAVLRRGYAVVQAADGHTVTSAGNIQAGEILTLRFGDDSAARVRADAHG